MLTSKENELRIRELIENWAEAVRVRNINAVLAFHSENLVMYDVPEPFQSVGLDAYRNTWLIFFKYTKMGVFDIHELNVVADENVAFAYAKMQCFDKSNSEDFMPLDFRLTTGLKKDKKAAGQPGCAKKK
ncbi:MAG: nuclear transport factor 2 family protein [Bacteroidota bacterium]|nr:nuclear transport factor 2 family protein [Bacteroidota bacterium]